MKKRPNRRSNERGQALAELALILALVAVLSIFSLTIFGIQVDDVLTTIGNSVSDALDQAAPGQPGHTHKPKKTHPPHP